MDINVVKRESTKAVRSRTSRRLCVEGLDRMIANAGLKAATEEPGTLYVDKELETNMKKSSSERKDPKKFLMMLMKRVGRKASNNKIPYSMICENTFLRLRDPRHTGNYVIFQKIWRENQALIVSNIAKYLNLDLWHPSSFAVDYEHIRVDLFNLSNEEIIPNQPLKIFWDGFEDISKRLIDDGGDPILLKICNWPSCANFHQLLQSRETDLFQALPLPAYTQPDGLLNFAHYLPDGYVTEEIGTRLSCAYGSLDHSNIGTTKLQKKITDFLNVLIYAGIGNDAITIEENEGILKVIQDAGCDNQSLLRVKKHKEIPGAIWHIYNMQDENKLNEFLSEISEEKGYFLDPQRNPIQDAKWYLDDCLRERLAKDYNIQGQAVLQCVGDAVFIPAGVLYQVRNLYSCVSVTQDFVSLKNVQKL